MKVTRTLQADLRKFEGMTWRDLIQGALEELGGTSKLEKLYEVISGTKKAQNNQHWKEKVRQTLQLHQNFKRINRGEWSLAM